MAQIFSFRKWLFSRIASPVESRKFSSKKVARRHKARPRLEELEGRWAPATTLSIADTSAVEPAPHGTANMVFTVTRNGDLSSQLTVGYKTVPGTAQAGTDFTAQTGTATFAPGAATTTISVPIFGNGVFDNPSLTFSVQLTGVVNAVGPPITLATPQTFSAGTKPTFVTLADVNGDGKPDAIVTAGNSVSVLLNTAAPGAMIPSFAAPQTFATGTAPQAVKVADINGDGLPDLIVANGGSATVSVLLNTTAPGAATASFAAQQTFTVGAKPVALAVGDLNGDGKPDIVVANSQDNTVSVLLNTTSTGLTTPTFANQQTFPTAAGPASVLLGDLNRDSKLDIAVACSTDNMVSVLLNTMAPGATTASFAAQQSFATGKAPQGLALADMSGDGLLDVITANNGDNTVSLLLNTTAPGATTLGFAAPQPVTVGSKPVAVVVGDLNGDGKRDLVVVNSGDNTLSLLLNTSAAGTATFTFSSQKAVATGASPVSLALGDVNGDGMPDLVIDNSGDGNLGVLLNTTIPGLAATGPAFTQTGTSTVGTGPFAIASADINGDGKPDVIVSNAADYTVSVLLNTTPAGAATPSFAPQATFNVGTYPLSIAVADLNGDGKPDIAVANDADKTVSVLLNTTAAGGTVPTFAAAKTFPTGSYPVSVAVADINGDGLPDLVVANEGDSTVSVMLNTTAPGALIPAFAAQQTFPTGSSPIAVTTGDLNGDGLPDIVVANGGENSVTVLLNATTPGATTPAFGAKQTFTTGPYPVSVAIADLNGDGKPDLAVANFGTHFNPVPSVAVLLNKTATGAGVPSFAQSKSFTVGSEPAWVTAGDVNGDGKPDLIVADQAGHAVSMLLNSTAPGATTPAFQPQQSFPTGGDSIAVALADVNGDGLPDVVAAQYSSKTAAVLLSSPATLTRATAVGTIIESDVPSQGGPATSLTVNAVSSAAAGAPVVFTVTALNAAHNPTTSYNGTIHFTSTDPQAILPPDTALTGGTGLFIATLKTAGSQTISVADTSTASLAATSNAVAISPAPANRFGFSGTPTSALTGSPFNFTVTALDAFGNVATAYSGHVHFTSSDAAASLPADATLTAGTGTFSATLKTAGSQTLTAIDTVSTNPVIAGTTSAIAAHGLTVTGLAPQAAGFTVTFNKPIVSSSVSLYGGSTANSIHNVTLIGKNTGAILGPVNGIFVIDPSGTSATFKASTDWLANIAGQTDGLLPNDTWSVTLQSGTGTGSSATGFFDTLGAPLDGGNNGGHADFTTTFVTSNDGKTALTIPDFARGPDGASTIKVPNNSAKGVPVTLAAAPAGTKDVVFTLHYNTALLTVTGASTGDSSGTGSTFTAGTPNNGAVTFTWHNGTGLSGNIVLGDIVANVPNSAANLYKAKELLTIDGITVNGTALTLTSPAVHINAYFGDLSGDGQITGLDLAGATNIAAGSATSPIGLAAYRLVDPGMIGDIGGNGSIDSAAISSLAGFLAHVPTPAIPTPPSGLTIAPGGPDPVLSLGAVGRVANPSYSDVVNVPVLLDHARPDASTGMTEAIIGLTYDPTAVAVSPADISLGSLPASSSGWRLVSVVDAATGQIAIDLYSTTPITQTQAGSLVNIAFHTAPGAYVPATAVQLVSSVSPQGHWYSTEVVDAENKFVLSPGVDRLIIPTGALVATPVSTTVVAPTSVEHGQVSSDTVVRVEEGPISQLGADAHDAFTLMNNGSLADQTPQMVPVNVVVTGALAFQQNALSLAAAQFVGLQLGSQSIVNAFQSAAPRQLIDRVFLALGQWADAASDSAADVFASAVLDCGDWLAVSAAATVQKQPSSSLPGQERTADRQVARDGVSVMDRIFARLADESNDLGDFGEN
jgi:hypothetical protein